MRRVSSNAYAEFYFTGSNPGFVVTVDGLAMFDTPQQPIDAIRWAERVREHGPIRYLINTEPHADHISGNAFFPEAEVIGHVGIQRRYMDEFIPMSTSKARLERLEQTDPDSVWLFNHPAFPPRPPTRTFTHRLTVELGQHTIECINMPGHTEPQTTIYLPQEGVAFTGDSVFHQVKTFLHEADPWQLLDTLKAIGDLDVEVIVPGHGEPCNRSYLAEQAQIVANWVGVVEDMVRRGLTEDEALGEPLDVSKIDPYPIAQRIFAVSDKVTQWNISNLHRRILARQGSAAS